MFSYFHPGYEAALPNGQLYNAPEFELLSDATSISAADLAGSFAYGKVPGVTIDLSPYVTPLGTAPTAAQISAMVDSLATALLGGRMPIAMHDSIVTAASVEKTPTAMVQTAVYLIGSSWNFQVER